ncbi:MAG: enoyl-CoA hydratase-related protein [candidate division KSB1 bacterium]|nr:enoyl-CoA hydratase-related protein [candidate division KSB1 bacterium]
MTYEQIIVSVENSVATVTLNRPERLNAYTPQMRRELTHAFAALDADDTVRAIIVTGAGRAFCAGADMSSGERAFDRSDDPEYLVKLAQERAAAVRPWELTKPVIAAINGVAVGAGATITLQWDIRLAAASARLGFIFVRRGLCPEALSTWLLPRLIGFSRAAELLLSGRMITADEALSYGLVSQVVPDEELLPAAHRLAEDIVKHTAPVAVAVTKRLLWEHLTQNDWQSAERLEQRAFTWCGAQPDAREGVRAFLEKRPPHWRLKPTVDMPEFLKPRRSP